jgi:hypothetical protein
MKERKQKQARTERFADREGEPGFEVRHRQSRGSTSIDWEAGAGEGIRTLDPDLGKVVLYP